MISLDQGGYSSLHDLYLIISPNDLMQTEQNGKEYQGTRAIDFVAITEKNKKRYVRIKMIPNKLYKGYANNFK